MSISIEQSQRPNSINPERLIKQIDVYSKSALDPLSPVIQWQFQSQPSGQRDVQYGELFFSLNKEGRIQIAYLGAGQKKTVATWPEEQNSQGYQAIVSKLQQNQPFSEQEINYLKENLPKGLQTLRKIDFHLGGHKAQLFESTTKSTAARQRFINYLEHLQGQKLIRRASGPNQSVSLEGLLGKEGVQLLQEAMDEEYHSEAYREAVFLDSIQAHAYQGPPLKQQLVQYVAGPSGSGKSRSSQTVVGATLAAMSREAKGTGAGPSPEVDQNRAAFIVSIDGAIQRGRSQMTHILQQFCLEKGYGSISNEVKPRGKKLKGTIEEVAYQAGCHLLIPETFSKPGASIRKKMQQYANNDQVKMDLINIVGEDAKTFGQVVQVQGSKRAQTKTKGLPVKFDLNDSAQFDKPYQAKYFKFGLLGSKRAANFVQTLTGRPCREIVHDGVLVNPQGEKINGEIEPAQATIIPRRALEAWNKIKNKTPLSFKDWWEKNKGNSELTGLLIRGDFPGLRWVQSMSGGAQRKLPGCGQYQNEQGESIFIKKSAHASDDFAESMVSSLLPQGQMVAYAPIRDGSGTVYLQSVKCEGTALKESFKTQSILGKQTSILDDWSKQNLSHHLNAPEQAKSKQSLCQVLAQTAYLRDYDCQVGNLFRIKDGSIQKIDHGWALQNLCKPGKGTVHLFEHYKRGLTRQKLGGRRHRKHSGAAPYNHLGDFEGILQDGVFITALRETYHHNLSQPIQERFEKQLRHYLDQLSSEKRRMDSLKSFAVNKLGIKKEYLNRAGDFNAMKDIVVRAASSALKARNESLCINAEILQLNLTLREQSEVIKALGSTELNLIHQSLNQIYQGFERIKAIDPASPKTLLDVLPRHSSLDKPKQALDTLGDTVHFLNHTKFSNAVGQKEKQALIATLLNFQEALKKSIEKKKKKIFSLKGREEQKKATGLVNEMSRLVEKLKTPTPVLDSHASAPGKINQEKIQGLLRKQLKTLLVAQQESSKSRSQEKSHILVQRCSTPQLSGERVGQRPGNFETGPVNQSPVTTHSTDENVASPTHDLAQRLKNAATAFERARATRLGSKDLRPFTLLKDSREQLPVFNAVMHQLNYLYGQDEHGYAAKLGKKTFDVWQAKAKTKYNGLSDEELNALFTEKMSSKRDIAQGSFQNQSDGHLIIKNKHQEKLMDIKRVNDGAATIFLSKQDEAVNHATALLKKVTTSGMSITMHIQEESSVDQFSKLYLALSQKGVVPELKFKSEHLKTVFTAATKASPALDKSNRTKNS